MNKRITLLTFVIITGLLTGCNKVKNNASQTNDSQITIKSSTEKIDTTITSLKENDIIKNENKKFYLKNNKVIDVSHLTLLGEETNDSSPNNGKKHSRLFTFNRNGKDMYYVYKSPVKKEVDLKCDFKGTEITGILSSLTETSLQIEDDNIYEVSLNCYVYNVKDEYKPYLDSISELKSDNLIKALVVNNKIETIFIIS